MILDRPWEQYQGTGDYLLLEPGWAGAVDDDELAFIQRTLQQDPALSFSWGFRPGQKTRSVKRLLIPFLSDL